MKLLNRFSIDRPSWSMGAAVLSIILAIGMPSHAQQLIATDEEKQIAFQELSRLQKGTLVVVLKSDKKQLDALDDVIQSEKSNRGQKKRAMKQRKKLMEGRKGFQADLVKAFYNLFTFSDFVVVFDHDLTKFKDDVEEGVFLNKKLEYDSSIELKEGDIFFAREGYTDPQEGARVLSYIVYDDENNRLDHPFPSVKISNLGPTMILKGVFENSDYRNADLVVERFDYKLKHRMATLREFLEIK